MYTKIIIYILMLFVNVSISGIYLGYLSSKKENKYSKINFLGYGLLYISMLVANLFYLYNR